MADYTNEVTRICERRAVSIVAFHDERPLFTSEVSLDEVLGDCGCSSQECEDIEVYINKFLARTDRVELDDGTVTVETTIKELISYVC